MKKFLILSLLYLQCSYADPLEKYFAYVEQLSEPIGNQQEGEIEIVTDPTDIARIQKIQENRLIKKGFSREEAAEYSQVGIVSEDEYWIWLRDAVYFPGAVPGTYDRLLWKSELKRKFPGVAVLPLMPSGQIALILNYRHATRSWELELPRGGRQPHETSEEAALRELKEETGLLAPSLIFLGEMAPDAGVMSSLIPVYLAQVSAQVESDLEYSEAVASVISFSPEELKEGLIQGFLEVTVEGKKKRAALRDPFLTFALLQALYRGV